MKLSMMSILFRAQYREGTVAISDFIRYAAETGVEGVELTRVDETGAEKDVDAALAQTGLAVASYNVRVALLSAEAAERSAAWEIYRQGLRRAKALGASSMMLFPGPLGIRSADEERKHLVQALRECARIASGEDITLTMESMGVPPNVQVHGTISHMLEIVNGVDSDNFRLAFDTGNFIYAGEDPSEAIRKLAPFTAHVHLKDIVKKEGTCVEVAIGTGIVDYSAILQELAKVGYNGFLSVECAGEGDVEAKKAMMGESVTNARKFSSV